MEFFFSTYFPQQTLIANTFTRVPAVHIQLYVFILCVRCVSLNNSLLKLNVTTNNLRTDKTVHDVQRPLIITMNAFIISIFLLPGKWPKQTLNDIFFLNFKVNNAFVYNFTFYLVCCFQSTFSYNFRK